MPFTRHSPDSGRFRGKGRAFGGLGQSQIVSAAGLEAARRSFDGTELLKRSDLAESRRPPLSPLAAFLAGGPSAGAGGARSRAISARISANNTYLNGELCGVLPNGRTAFNLIQNASDTDQDALVFFPFDLLFLHGKDLTEMPRIEREARLKKLLSGAPPSLVYNDH